LFLDELADLYNAESQVVHALPTMAKYASSPQLKAALQEHLEVTRGHVTRLDTIVAQLNSPLTPKACKGMEGLIKEGKELLHHANPSPVLDAGLIGAAQRVEHYEMAAYGTARAHAQQLGKMEAAKLLAETLAEEKAADEKLTQLAERGVNAEAA
jgi:ferritin-like metal-binding protein YciE